MKDTYNEWKTLCTVFEVASDTQLSTTPKARSLLFTVATRSRNTPLTEDAQTSRVSIANVG